MPLGGTDARSDWTGSLVDTKVPPVSLADRMPVTYQIDHDQRLVIATPHGKLTDADIFGYQQEVWSRLEVRGYNELIDMAGVSEIEFISTKRVAFLADLSASMDPPALASKLAIIATTDLHFGLARMYETYRETAKQGTKAVRVFRNRSEAARWLGAGIQPASEAT
jgi:predicted phage-related endonuclease